MKKEIEITGVCTNCGKETSTLKITIEFDEEKLNLENAKILDLN